MTLCYYSVMPFKSKAQRRLFYALKQRGLMSQKTIQRWEDKTPKRVPERLGESDLKKSDADAY